tara:strand:- start:23236 stop:23430 length:195 start_codon:yes stop_codon:yes gene_type:complete
MFRTCRDGVSNHKFEPRYDEMEINRPPMSLKSEGGHSTKDIRKLFVKKVYVKDICVHCGKEIRK